MKGHRTDETTEARAEPLARPLARSLVLYAVLGTLALQVGGAPASRAQEQQPQPSSQQGAPREVRGRAKFNPRPLREILRRAAEMHRRGEINAADPASLTVEADINEDGSLASPLVSFTGGDVALKGFAHLLVEALDESRALGTMEGVTHVRLVLSLDGHNFSAGVLADASSPEQAERLSSGYNTLLGLARAHRKKAPEAVVFNNMTVSASGKQLSLRLDMTREALGNLLLRQVTPN